MADVGILFFVSTICFCYYLTLRRTDFSVIKLENNEKYMFRYGNISVDSGFLCGKARNLRRDFPFILLDYSVKC